ncbi:MAG TPA: hypothetical protein VIX63_17580 [Vicinamibacterales bacterium]
MAYGEYGGNRSIHWLVDADDVDELTEKGSIGNGRRGDHREWRQHGVDYHGKSEDLGDDFTIRIKVPEKNRTTWLAQLKRQVDAAAKGEILEFKLPIVRSDVPHTQVQVCWGKTCEWQDHLYLLSQELNAAAPEVSQPPEPSPSV